VSQGALTHIESQGVATPEWMVKTQCALFATLWAVTMLPNILIVRNFALVLGAIIGLYIAFRNREALISKKVIPIAVIALLFLWVTWHLLFIGKNHTLQWAEYGSLWRRALLGSLFALGLGLSLIRSKRSDWGLIFAGLCGPVVIYYFKYFAGFIATHFGFSLPEALILFSSGVSSFYIPKISYVFFCLPAFAVSLGYIAELFRSKDIKWKIASIYIAPIIGVLGIFYLENIKNGFIYAVILTLIFFIYIFRSAAKALSWKSYCLLALLGLAIFSSFLNNIYANDSWKTLVADYKIASHAQPVQIWSSEASVYPINEYGRQVSITNFDRVFYLTTALTFVKQYPMGYGLVQSSFGHIARENFPSAPLIQSHSGWMDLTLGLGIPGALLLLVASIFAMLQVTNVPSPWSIFGVWSLLSIVLLLLTTEAGQKNYVDTFVWLVVMVGGLGLGSVTQNRSKQ
jgi:O-Antigen ligase